MDQRVGTAATISIIAAIGCYVLVFTGHPFLGMFAAIVSIPAGIIGFVMAASPRVRGGIMSLAAIGLGVLGMVFSVLGMIGAVVF